MSLRPHLGEDVLDSAVGADDKRRALDPHHLLAIHVLFLQDAECLRDFLVSVGEQGEGNLELVLKLLLGSNRIG